MYAIISLYLSLRPSAAMPCRLRVVSMGWWWHLWGRDADGRRALFLSPVLPLTSFCCTPPGLHTVADLSHTMRKLGLVILLLFLVFSFFASVACGEELESLGEGGTEEELKRGHDGGGGRCTTDADCNNNGECEPIEGEDIAVCRCDERYAGSFFLSSLAS